jgi:hypothetical protein
MSSKHLIVIGVENESSNLSRSSIVKKFNNDLVELEKHWKLI